MPLSPASSKWPVPLVRQDGITAARNATSIGVTATDGYRGRY
jgi:hypothetical protein